MEGFEDGFIELELKYCERCGALWLRLKDSDSAVCGRCMKAMAGLPRWQRIEFPDEVSISTVRHGAFWAEGGNA